MNSGYTKYLLRKTEYLTLKSQHGGALPPVIERGVGYNIKKFMSIIDNNGIFSANRAAALRISSLESHAAATGGNDCVSFSAKGTPASGMYSVNGITFIVNTENLIECTSKRGSLPGEVYIENNVPLKNITHIYVHPEAKDIVLEKLPICALDYGSTPLKTKLQYQFEACGANTTCIQQIAPDMEDLINKYNKAVENKTIEYNKLMRKNPTEAKDQNLIKKHLYQTHMYPVEVLGAELYVKLLIAQLKNPAIKTMTLGQFVEYYLKLKKIVIPVIYTLDY